MARKKELKKENMALTTLRRMAKNKMAILGLILLIIITVLSILAPYISPYGYEVQDSYNTLAGYYGGKVDTVIMRFLDILQAIPAILLAISISAVLGTGFFNCILSVSAMPGFARMARASCLSVQSMEYVEAARSINAREARIIFKHVLPNAISPIFVHATMSVASAILTAASLSFIGLGVQPPDAEWGAMLSAGRNYIRSAPHLVLFPGIVIMITVLSLNMLGDGLRDALDPRLKN